MGRAISRKWHLALAICIFAATPACHRKSTEIPPLEVPVGPVEVIEAAGVLDGGTKFAALRDARGHEYGFLITPFSYEDKNRTLPTNRLLAFRWGERPPTYRLIEIDSSEERIVGEALELAIKTLPQSVDEVPPEQRYWRSTLESMLERLDTLGKSRE